MSMVDVLCYRDYTREGKRVNTHSLFIKGVKLPTDVDKNGLFDVLCRIHDHLSYLMYIVTASVKSHTTLIKIHVNEKMYITVHANRSI